MTQTTQSEQKNTVHLIYLLFTIGFFVPGIVSLVGIIVAYIKREDMQDYPVLSGHIRWLIRTFWYSILWVIVGLATLIIGVGFIILAATYIWHIYRIIKGWIWLNDNKSVY